jgi:methyltransferase-like protein
MILGKIHEEIDCEKFFILLKNPKRNEVTKNDRKCHENITNMSTCSHSSAMEDIMEHFANNFSLHPFKKSMSRKYKKRNKEEFLTKVVLLIVLSDEEGKDVMICSPW